MEEERRKCFVAITRCRETLTLSRDGRYDNGGKAGACRLRIDNDGAVAFRAERMSALPPDPKDGFWRSTDPALASVSTVR